MSEAPDRRAAGTIGELDVHISYIQQTLRELVTKAEDMATKQDIRELEQRMSSFATKDELKALETKFNSETVTNKFDNFVSWVTKIGAAVGVIAAGIGGVAAMIHFIDKVNK